MRTSATRTLPLSYGSFWHCLSETGNCSEKRDGNTTRQRPPDPFHICDVGETMNAGCENLDDWHPELVHP